MSSKKVLAGVVAATVMNVASASNTAFVMEKQNKAAVMADLLDGITVVMAHPECTVKAPTIQKSK